MNRGSPLTANCFQRWILISFSALIVAGCTTAARQTLIQPSPQDPATDEIVAGRYVQNLKRINAGLNSFKGIGRATIRRGGTRQTLRAAWMGSEPNRIRIEILGVAGQPMVRFASDGAWVYLMTTHPDRFIKKRFSEDLLEKFLAMPGHPSDLVDFISGRVPVRKHANVSVMSPNGPLRGSASGKENRSSTGSRVIVLKQWWGQVVEKIYMSGGDGDIDVQAIEMFRNDGSLAYWARFIKKQTVDGYTVPSILEISDDRELSFRLDIHGYWVNVDPEASQFVLTPPEGNEPES